MRKKASKVRNLFKRKFYIQQLMSTYGMILSLTIVVLMIASSLFLSSSRIREQKFLVNQTSNNIERTLTENENVLSGLLSELSGSASQFDNMREYIHQNRTDYFNYLIEKGSDDTDLLNFPSQLTHMFQIYPNILAIDLSLNDTEKIMHATRNNPGGMLVSKTKDIRMKNSFRMIRTIYRPNSMDSAGEMTVYFSEESVLGAAAKSNPAYGVDSYVFSYGGGKLYRNGMDLSNRQAQEILDLERDDNKQKKLSFSYYYITKWTKSYYVAVILDKATVYREIFTLVGIIVAIGVLALVTMLVLLGRTFRSYAGQVEFLISDMKEISRGNLNKRIDTEKVEMELSDLGSEVNAMVDTITKLVRENYRLDLEQKDANMRALQSQINPHFFYNTLEYIRMYALSKQQNELAEVVYTFAALLRNNINQDKTTTIKEELDFVEKYIYLFQMRYPNRVSYEFTMDEGLEELVIPKFLIQPIVENYFVHGIDFLRNDNLLTIDVSKKTDDKVEIVILDNGKGMTEATLEKVRASLTPDAEQTDSVGVRNVYERLYRFTGYKGTIEAFSEVGEGTKFVITMPLEEEDHV
jgi:two-component system sensor histidine kinase YesM